MSHTTIAISAIAGSFTEEAAREYLANTHQEAEFVYVGTAHGAFGQVASGKAGLGIVPIRNSNAGFVLENLYASADYTYKILEIITISVHQNLMVLPGTKPADVTEIVSQLPALVQSNKYLHRAWPDTPQAEYADTALAARDLAAGKLKPSTAVIASRSAAERFGLKILKTNIQNDQSNHTEFMVFTKHA
ncbi:MAG: chorismate mutase [Patescibacteria group bacterium]|nr:chorismate mutase [Patescibacteria group bacterium]